MVAVRMRRSFGGLARRAHETPLSDMTGPMMVPRHARRMPQAGAFQLFREIRSTLHARNLTIEGASAELRHIASLHPDGLYPDDVARSFALRHGIDACEEKIVLELLAFLVHCGDLQRNAGRLTSPVLPPQVAIHGLVPLDAWPQIQHLVRGDAWVVGPTDRA